jgi:hypothetical protein
MIIKVVLLLVLTSLSSIAVSAQKANTWHNFRSAAGRFSIDIPCEPKVASEPVEDAASSQFYHSCSGESAYFMISYLDMKTAAKPKLVLDKFRDGVVSGSGATIISETSITLMRHPGRAVTTKTTVNGVDVIYNWHFYFVRKRIYGVGMAVSQSRSDSPDINRFLSSFTLEQ